MNMHITTPGTMADLLRLIDRTQMPTHRRRDMISAIKRLCSIMRCSPEALAINIPELRGELSKIRPSAHGISEKTFSNQKSLLAAALVRAGVIDSMAFGIARKDPCWGPLLRAISHDQRLSYGLAAFANGCTRNKIRPEVVTDTLVMGFLKWLETRTLCPKPKDIARRVPNLWNDARKQIKIWPQIKLTPVSFRPPSENLTWSELNEAFRKDAESYLAARANPDVFDERFNAPRRPLSESTVDLQRAHIRLAASVLVRHGIPVEEITRLADLVEPEAFKKVLRHYHVQAKGGPSAFAIGLSKTLIQTAKYHSETSPSHLDRLKAIATKLPCVPFDLTEKNKSLLQQFDSDTVRAKLIYLSEDLLYQVQLNLGDVGRNFVDAQVAVAVDIALIAPLRPQNLSRLNWNRHFTEPDGKRGRLLLRIPAQETKTRKRDLTFELPVDVAQRLRWYRYQILPRLGADPNGDLFVNFKGSLKDQKTLTSQIIKRIEKHVGVHMTPHQFRHLAAKFYLEQHPEDFRTVTDLLGHSSTKTTLIYAGASIERASRVYSGFVVEQREALKLKRKPRKKKRS